MKIFHKGKLVSSYGKGKKMEGRTKKNNGILIAKYKFYKSMYDNLIPEFNEGFVYTYEDIVDGEVTTRSIYSNSLPTKIIFGSGTGANEKTQSLLEVNYINTSNIKIMRFMFRSCENLIAVNSSNWDTSSVTNFQDMFYECKKLTSLDVSSWDTTNVVTIASMFCDCWNLQNIIGLNKWNIYKTTSVSGTLARCYALENIDISNWHLNESIQLSYLFHDSTNLKHIEMKSSDYNSVNKIISQLPTRTADSMGALDIEGIDNISQVDIATLNSKYWTIVSHTILNNARLGQTKLN